MRNLFTTFMLLLLLGSLSACTNTTSPVVPENPAAMRTAEIVPDSWYGDCSTTPLIVAQEEMGTVTVCNDNEYLYIDVWVDDDCFVVVDSHVAVGESLDDIPTNKSGNPKIGNFPYTIDEPIPLSDFSECAATLVMAVHVVVECVDEWGGIESQTGWADGDEFTEGRSWAMYFNYDVTKGLPIPDPNCVTIQSFYPGAHSYWDTYILSGLGDLEELYRRGYDEGDPYRGWCVDLTHTMGSGVTYTCAGVYPTTSADEFPEGDPRFGTDWHYINWIINNKGDYTINQIQDAIWYFTNGKDISGPALELAMAAEEHPDFYPAPCEWIAVLLRAGNNQLIMIEVDP